MNLLTLKLKATECNGWPKLRVLLDLDIIETYEFISEHAEIIIPIDLYNGSHSLIIEIFGKTSKNTIVDSQGHIVNDQLIELTDMIVDDIILPDIYKYQGVYKFNGKEFPQALSWGCNGIWQWDFEIPLITWLLDVKINNDEKFNPSPISPKDRLAMEFDKISQLENQLNKIQ